MKGNSQTIILGRVGNDAEVKSHNGRDLINFSIAEDDGYKDKNGTKVDRTIWHKAQIWRKGGTAEKFAKFITKGKQLLLTGKSRAGAYIKDDKAVAVNDFIVEELKFIGGQATVPKPDDEAPF